MSAKIGGANFNLSNAEGLVAVAGLVVVGYVLFEALGLIKKGTQAATTAVSTGVTSFLNTPGSANSPNNLNAGTPYAGTGVPGSIGSFFNSILGGAPQAVGEYIGSPALDSWSNLWASVTGGSTSDQVAAAAQGANRDQVVTPNYIDDISGSVGGTPDTSSSLDSSYDFGLGGSSGSDGSGGVWF